MSSLLNRLYHSLPWVHPTLESLLRHADGETLPSVERHLARCAACRREAERFASAVLAGSRDARLAPALDDVFGGLQLRIAAWRSLGDPALAQASAARPVHAGVVEAVELYFGKESSRRLQRCGPRSLRPGELIHTAKPLFSTFLGSAAADALTNGMAELVA